MRRWKFLIVLSSATAALAVALGAEAQTEGADLLAMLASAFT